MISHVRRVQLWALAAGLPAVLLSLYLLQASSYGLPVRVLLGCVVVAVWVGLCVRLARSIVVPLHTISNLLSALREGDFSIRARGAATDDPLAAVMLEINSLSDTLRTQRLGAHEATALLRAVMAEIDVAILAFDSESRLALINRYGERLLGRPAADLYGSRSEELGLGEAFAQGGSVQDIAFPGANGKWEVRRRRFWQGGTPHELVVLADVSQPLREQEREAWLRLIRVVGHELNNSLAPIKSIAGSLEMMLSRTPPPDDWRTDMQHGLGIIAARAGALSRFTTAYAQLARLPAPALRPIPLAPLIRRVVGLDRRLPIRLIEGPDILIRADGDQIEQMLINLLRNAVDAATETAGAVSVTWSADSDVVEIWIDDEGPGVRNTANLFVPFFTTKAGGSGIGLVLSRQIAEAHGGMLKLESRGDARGTRAVVRVPRTEPHESRKAV